MTIEVNTKGIEEWGKNKEKSLLNMFKKIGVEGEGLLYKEAKDVYYTGQTAKSIRNIATSSEVKIQATAEYATQALETGTPPGRMPNVNAMKMWAQKKLGNAGLGFAVAKKIKEKGSYQYRKGGRKGVTKVFNELKDSVAPRYFKEVQEAYAD
jgi:hypothetical protein